MVIMCEKSIVYILKIRFLNIEVNKIRLKERHMIIELKVSHK